MFKIDKKKLYKEIQKNVNKYYALKEKPTIVENSDNEWVQGMIMQMVEFAVIEKELVSMNKITIPDNVIKYDHKNVQENCIKKRNYKIMNVLGDENRGNKYLLAGNKTIKINRIYMWEYEQKDEMKSAIENEFDICKKAEKLNIGPKTFDCFICMAGNVAFKAVVSEYIKGIPMNKWMEGKSKEQRLEVHNVVKKKLDIMHSNGIIHNNMSVNNIIVKNNGDVLFTDFVGAYDINDKKMWQYNKWIRGDRRVLDEIKTGSYSWNNTMDVLKYVASQLLVSKKI